MFHAFSLMSPDLSLQPSVTPFPHFLLKVYLVDTMSAQGESSRRVPARFEREHTSACWLTARRSCEISAYDHLTNGKCLDISARVNAVD